MVKAGTILLVDDEDIVLRVQAAAVRQFGFHAVIATTAQEALDKAAEIEPELILSDVEMPGEGGFDFVGSLERRGLKNMPVIYLTAYDDVRLVSGGLAAGGDDFVIKGGPIKKLRNRIAFWMISGFRGLPIDIKRRALSAASDSKEGAFLGVESSLELDYGRIAELAAQLSLEMEDIECDDFGRRMIDRVSVMGRASKLLIDRSKTTGDYVRFPDYLRLVMQRLGRDWSSDFTALFGAFDMWSKDIRFVRAGPVPLRASSQYDLTEDA